MDESSYGRDFVPDKKNEIMFGCEMLYNQENIALGSSEILYIFVLREILRFQFAATYSSQYRTFSKTPLIAR
jgi:hypothetical protein